MSNHRYFTVAEANQTLPLVRRIVADIVSAGQQLRTVDSTNESASVLHQQLNDLLAELDEIGCSYRDWNFELGLVDFPAFINGQEVLLCWRSDEATVAHYHGIRAGYAGRKPIPHSDSSRVIDNSLTIEQ